MNRLRACAIVTVGVSALACSAESPRPDAQEDTGGASSSGLDSGATTRSSAADSSDGTDATGDPGARADGWRWTFDDGIVGALASTAAGAVADDGGAGLVGTLSAPLRYVEGVRPGTVALAFTGDGAHVRLDGAEALRAADILVDDSLRIEVAFRTDVHGQGGAQGAGTLLARGGDAQGWWLGIVDGRLALTLGTGDTVIEGHSDTRVDDGAWHRATVTYDREAGAIVITVDGTHATSIAVDAGAVVIAGTEPVVAGVDGDGARPFVGDLDQIALVRTPPPPITPGPRRATSTVFEAGAVPRPGGGTYAKVRIPAVVATPPGTLLAFAEGRVHGECDIGDIDIVMSRSTDGGATWSPAQTLLDPGVHRVWDPIPIVDAVAGRVVLMTTTHLLDPGCNPSPASCACDVIAGGTRVEVRTSDDDGLTFGAPIDVTDAVTDASGSSLLIGPAHGIQLTTGAHAGALVVPAMHRRSGDGKRGGHILRSDDGGTTWSIIATETASDVNVNESTVAELADGDILVNTRHQLGADEQTPAEVAAGLRGEARLTAAGEWATDPAFTRVATFRGPVVHGTLLAWPGSDRHGDERRLLFTLPAGEHGTNVGRRHDLRLWVSHDDGAQWVEGVRLAGDFAAYSDVVAIDEDHVGVLFEAGADADEFYHRIDFVRAAVQTLDDATLASWTFEDGAVDDIADGGPHGLVLGAQGTVTAVDGRHASTAIHLEGDGRLCRGEPGLRSALDFGGRDSFAIEAVFRTSDHAAGGSEGAGVLVAKTRTGTEPAWWLRVEDGRVRFLATACDGTGSNCGVVPGECGGLPSCDNVGVLSRATVSDGEWHRVVVARDALAGTLRMTIDDGETVESPWPAGDVVKNDEPVCLGAFADGARGFVGDLDLVRVRSRPSP